jgi:hypothetical protein
MNPVLLTWDSRTKSVYVKWNGFLSLGWENGRLVKRMLGIPIPFGFRRKGERIGASMMRWAYLKEAVSFLRKWELKKVEGTLSFSDPMVNGILYGWMSAIATEKTGRKIDLTINFLGENWCSGEATVSPKILFYHLRRWALLFFGGRGRRP